MDAYIFGARATAAGLYRALLTLGREKRISGFLVSNTEKNLAEVWGVPVISISDFAGDASDEKKRNVRIYVAVPELLHKEVLSLLTGFGFSNIIRLTARMESDIMRDFYEKEGRFMPVQSLGYDGKSPVNSPKIAMYVASFWGDKPLSQSPVLADYMKRLHLGCALGKECRTDNRNSTDFYDDVGDNISKKNPNRCEMTAHYWVWKNRLSMADAYVGICHYRRMLDLSEADFCRIVQNDVDVVLPYPMIHYPNAAIQHTWYVQEKDWELMRQVVEELQPAYGEKFDEVFQAHEFYNYNMLVAKKNVFADYCAWLYPILDRIEELSEPIGAERNDRYTAYLSESLETLYFMANLKNLKIFHTGRLLYT